MIRNLLLTVTALILSAAAFAQGNSYRERAAAYVAQYKAMAIQEQRRSGVPAAITLGQGILETEAGKSELATVANNHFGIKCKKDWKGETFAHDDDAPQECFRKYNDAAQSYKDHSNYLRTAPRYASCFALDATDYAGWARELRKCGYATNPKYAQILTKIIEDYQLQEYTYTALAAASAPVLIASTDVPVAGALMAEEKKSAPGEVVPEHDTPSTVGATPVYGQLVKRDGAKGFWAHKGDVLLEYAIQYKVRYAKILEINLLPDAPLAKDQFVYIEKGGRMDAMLSKDYSEPSLVAASAPQPKQEVAAVQPTEAAPVITDVAPQRITEQPATAASAATPSPVVTESKPASPAAPAVPEKPVVDAASGFSTPAMAPAAAIEAPTESAAKPPAEEQPMDEFARLKARLDQAVFATPKPRPAQVSAPAAVPAPTVAQASATSVKEYHTVQPGETMFGIARRYKISMKELMELNGLHHFEAIRVGQKLRVK